MGAASRVGGVGEGLKQGAGWGHPEASPGLASPSLPQLRFVVVHSETGVEGAGGHPPTRPGPDSQSREEGETGQRVEAWLPPDLPQARRKVIHSWLRSFWSISVTLPTTTPNEKLFVKPGS